MVQEREREDGAGENGQCRCEREGLMCRRGKIGSAGAREREDRMCRREEIDSVKEVYPHSIWRFCILLDWDAPSVLEPRTLLSALTFMPSGVQMVQERV